MVTRTKRRTVQLGIALAIHVIPFVFLLEWMADDVATPQLAGMSVRVLEVSTSNQITQHRATLPPAKHAPKKIIQAVRAEKAPAKSRPVPAPTPDADSSTTSEKTSTSSPGGAPITGARFDAAYLQNAKPVYPSRSRRLGEEGKVVLRVLVSENGLPLKIEFKQRSGFPRLDAAARSAVERWRFVAAHQGQKNIQAWVLVPLIFKLGR